MPSSGSATVTCSRPRVARTTASTPIGRASSTIRRSAKRTGASPTSRPSASTRRTLSAMQAQLARPSLDAENRAAIPLRARQGLRGPGEYAQVIRALRQGQCAAPRRAPLRCRAQFAGALARLKTVFTHEFFAERAGSGCAAADPIFIVGMPRAGSTLLEQILSSHSAVEGTTELPEIITMAKDLRAQGESRRHRRLCRGAGDARAPPNCASSASDTSSARASIARPAGHFSSTRCRTTSCTSA